MFKPDRNRSVAHRWVTYLTLAMLFAMPCAASTASIQGMMLGPEGASTQGFRAVFEQVGSGELLTSGPVSPGGTYQLVVPDQGRYVLRHVIDADGFVIPVENFAPVSVASAGATQMNVYFSNAGAVTAASAASAASGSATASGSAATPKRKTGKWVGVGLGISAAIVLAVALNDDDPSSPSAP